MATGDIYRAMHARSLKDPDGFWAEQADKLDWSTRWDQVLDASRAPFYAWYTGGTLNACHNALDRHADGGRGEQAALIYDSPVTGTRRTYTYRELRDEVARFAGALAGLGVGQGDEAVIAMLASARIGAVHSVVFGGFAPRELAVRIDDATPTVIVSASCGIEGKKVLPYKPLLDEAIEIAEHTPDKRVILQRPQATAAMGPDDVDWAEATASAEPA